MGAKIYIHIQSLRRSFAFIRNGECVPCHFFLHYCVSLRSQLVEWIHGNIRWLALYITVINGDCTRHILFRVALSDDF